MAAKNVPHMNADDGEKSYANNSGLQKTGMMRIKHMIDGALQEMCNSNQFPTMCFRMADLGCSSGPNTVFLIFCILDTVERLSSKGMHKVAQFEVFLNDLPGNDFNNLFRLLPTFYEKIQQERRSLRKRCFVSGTPGSFYDRLFADESLHFIHSSYSIHWLSQVPQGLKNNKGNIYISETSPPDVLQAYLDQFQKDFSTFLSLRATELIPGGRMVLVFLCRDVAGPATGDYCFPFTLLGKSLLDLAAEGLVKEADVDSFNIPMYMPYEDEVKAVIEKGGSFKLNELEVFGMNWDASGSSSDENYVFDKYKAAKIAAGHIRAFLEPLLVSHFGSSIMDHLFARFKDHMAEHLCSQSSFWTMAISLTRK